MSVRGVWASRLGLPGAVSCGSCGCGLAGGLEPGNAVAGILRFQRLRAWLAASGSGPGALARAAADCGYFDQAHLCRDCARLGGLTPATLLAASASPAQI